METKEAMPFAGLKVADFAWVGVGPITSRHLADFGADVVRIESSTRPDTLRMAPPFRDGVPGLNRSAFGAVYNTNKRGFALNLGKPKARELARKLVLWADVVTESMTPGSMAKLGLGYDDLRTIKPDVIMFSTTQMGQTGPYRDFGGYGSHGASTSGLLGLVGWPDREPGGLYGAYTDFVAPWFLFTTLVAALDHRDRTGQGQHLDQSQVEAGIHLLGPAVLDYFATGRALTPRGNDDPEMFPHGAYPCPGDDRWVAITIRDDKDWAALCRLIRRPEWIDDPEMKGAACRRARHAEIDAAIEAWTMQHPAYALMHMAQRAGVPAGAVQMCSDLFEDPQLIHRQHWWWLDHEEIGHHAYDAPVWKLSRTPSQPRRAGPALGQHTHEICHEVLGLTDDQIAELVAEGVLE